MGARLNHAGKFFRPLLRGGRAILKRVLRTGGMSGCPRIAEG